MGTSRIDELKHNVRQAIEGVLEVMKEQGGEPEASAMLRSDYPS